MFKQITISESTDAAALAGRRFRSPIGEIRVDQAWHSPSVPMIGAMVEVRLDLPGRAVGRTAYALDYGMTLTEI